MGGVDVKIMYGFCLCTDEHYKKMLKPEQVAELCDDNGEFRSYEAAMKVGELLDKVGKDIIVENVDFENSAEFGIDGECVLVGTVINSGGGHYTGVLELPQITSQNEQIIDAFVFQYSQFLGMKRNVYIHYDSNK
jgi:hypothetical protein